MAGLKTFIVQEAAQTDHVERYATYIDRYHHEVLIDLKDRMAKAWNRTVKTMSRTYAIDETAKGDLLLTNSKATTELAVVTSDTKLHSLRFNQPQMVSPSVKIPLLYNADVRHVIRHDLLVNASNVFYKLAEDWREIFQIEEKRRLKAGFNVVSDDDEVRFQLMVNSGGHEMYKTLYAVFVEYGKSSSKTRDHDKVYLTSLVR